MMKKYFFLVLIFFLCGLNNLNADNISVKSQTSELIRFFSELNKSEIQFSKITTLNETDTEFESSTMCNRILSFYTSMLEWLQEMKTTPNQVESKILCALQEYTSDELLCIISTILLDLKKTHPNTNALKYALKSCCLNSSPGFYQLASFMNVTTKETELDTIKLEKIKMTQPKDLFYKSIWPQVYATKAHKLFFHKKSLYSAIFFISKLNELKIKFDSIYKKYGPPSKIFKLAHVSRITKKELLHNVIYIWLLQDCIVEVKYQIAKPRMRRKFSSRINKEDGNMIAIYKKSYDKTEFSMKLFGIEMRKKYVLVANNNWGDYLKKMIE